MSLNRLALLVASAATGLLFVFNLGRVTQLVAGIAWLVVAATAVLGDKEL